MKTLFSFLLCFNAFCYFSQNSEITMDYINMNCNEPVDVHFSVGTYDLVNQPTTLHLEWRDGTIQDIPLNLVNTFSTYFADTSIWLNRSIYFINEVFLTADLRMANGTVLPLSESYFNNQSLTSGCNYGQALYLLSQGVYGNNSIIDTVITDLISPFYNQSNIVTTYDFFGTYQTNLNDYTWKFNTNWLQANDYTAFPSEIHILNGQVEDDFSQTLYTNPWVWQSYPHTAFIAQNQVPLSNISLSCYNNYTYNPIDTMPITIGTNFNPHSFPDTNLVIHIENPQNLFNVVPGNIKNLVVGNEYFEFQPRIGDYFSNQLRIELVISDSNLLTYGDHSLPVYFLNSTDNNPLDDTSSINYFHWEPCQGNTGTEIDLSLNCSSYIWDTTLYYEVSILKDICDSVNDVEVSLNFPSELTLDTSYLSSYGNILSLTDSTVSFIFDFGQYEFDYYIDFPFSFSSSNINTLSSDFEVAVSSINDLNGNEYCNQSPDFSSCNQIDTLNFYSNFNAPNSSTLILSASLNIANCTPTDIVHVAVSLPNGCSLLSNNLSNVLVTNNVVSFDLIGATNFEIPINVATSLLGQMIQFPITFSNVLDTTPSNNALILNYQLMENPCLDFDSTHISSYAYFEPTLNKFVLNYSSYQFCPDTSIATIHYSTNLIPLTNGLMNPVVSNNTLTFDFINQSNVEINFDYITYFQNANESFVIEIYSPQDTNQTNNSKILNATFPFNLCDSIDVNTNVYSSASMIAPTLSGTIYIYPNVLNCSENLSAILTLESWMTPNLTNLTGATYTNNQLYLTASFFNDPNNYGSIEVSIPGTTPASTPYTIYCNYSNGLDQSLWNNTDTIQGVVLNSYDPNEKLVDLQETISPDETEKLSYEIHFQNDGNYSALNITVIDTLDEDLDLSTFHFIGSKHFCIPSLDSISREVKFFFPNIQLAGSSFDLEASQGVFFYSISEKTGISNSASIENTAHIYFDYNPAIVTNTTVNTNGYLSLDEIQSESIFCYPNPASDYLYINCEESITEFQLVAFDGRKAPYSEMINKNTIDVSTVPSGIYILRILDKGLWKNQRVSISH